MKLYTWRGGTPNFGDELNALLWPALLPRFFDEDDTEIVLGIGSVLDRRHAPDQLKVVLGAGYGGYQAPPQIDRSWVVHWVRGPLTARFLGLDPAVGLGDPAMLWPVTADASALAKDLAETPAGGGIGFMPHFESLGRGAWAGAAEAAGLRLIDPRADPLDILAKIAGCRLLISEAMHGAIIADTLRVPWVAVEPLAAIHRAKWRDWAGALNLTIRFQNLPPSSLREWVSVSPLAALRPIGRGVQLAGRWLDYVGSRPLLDRAAGALRRLAAEPGQLSELTSLQRCQERMLSRLDAVRRHPREAGRSVSAGCA